MPRTIGKGCLLDDGMSLFTHVAVEAAPLTKYAGKQCVSLAGVVRQDMRNDEVFSAPLLNCHALVDTLLLSRRL